MVCMTIKRIIHGQEMVKALYVSVDGLDFFLSSDCEQHEEYINRMMERYEKLIDMGTYTLKQLYEIYSIYENNKTRLKQVSLKQWRFYHATQYALSKVLSRKELSEYI